MIRSTLTLQPWSPTAAARSGPPHTWIRAWPVDSASLRADATAAGWQWHSVEHVDHDAAVVAAVFDLFVQRERRQAPRNTLGEPHVLLAVGPDVPWHLRELRLIGFWGRSVDVHLAVSGDHRLRAGHHPHHPVEFSDCIGG